MMQRTRILLKNEFVRLMLITTSIFALMTLLRPSTFLTSRNLISMAFQMSEIGMLSLAIALAFISGGMDLSLIGISNLSGICAGIIMSTLMAYSASQTQNIVIIILAIVVSLLVGIVCGLINGILIGRLHVTPILATLGTMQLFTGIALIITQGTAVVGLPPEFSFIGQGSIGPIPFPMIIFLISAIAVHYLMIKTKLGIELRLIGTNEKAAHHSGINVGKSKIKSYIIGGFLAAISGLIMMSRANSAKADFGSSYTMLTILIAVLGGVSPSGAASR